MLILLDWYSICVVIDLTLILLFIGKNEFGSDEDAHVVGDCVKVRSEL